MEVVMSTSDINTLFSSLGCPIGDEYVVGDDCQAALEEILKRLYTEDKYVRGFRRLITNAQVIKRDLLPLFYNVKNDHKILDLIILIFENLTIPVECLFNVDMMIKEGAGRSTISELNWLLIVCKEAFLNPNATKCVIDYIKLNTKKQPQQLSPESAHRISVCLMLLRNLLHIPEVRGGAPGGGATHQNQMIWNLFTQHIDKLLIQLMTSNYRGLWSITMVQLISLMFKDQQSNTIYKLLSIWCNTALSESSEDDESNTSPQDRGSGDSSSSMATSDPTSDSSDSDHHKHKLKHETDVKHYHQPHAKQAAQTRMTEMLANGTGRKAQVAMRNKHGSRYKNNHPFKKQPDTHTHTQDLLPSVKEVRMCWSSESGIGSSIGSSESGNASMKMECNSPEMSECGSNAQETISTSSNEDKESSRFGKKKIVHQKPLNMIQKSRYINGKAPPTRKDLRQMKLLKRSKTNNMSIKTFLNHIPSEEDISHLLKEFTIDFLLKGYGVLVTELKAVVLTTETLIMDTSHFTWLIMFFLRFAAQLEVDLQLISPAISYDIVSFLTYEGVNLCEELEVVKLQADEHRDITIRKLYLVVSSIKEIIFTIETYQKLPHLTEADREYIRQLAEKVSCSNDLRCLFVLLLRHFDPVVQSLQYLQDVIVTNHHLLVLTENCSKVSKATMADHIKLFASEDVMKQYGEVLTCFEQNSEMVNNCIFTMMHHVAGDLDKVSVLFQPSIIKSFTEILRNDFELNDDWSDLVEYVVQKCLKSKQIKIVPAPALHFDGCEMNCSEDSKRQITPVPVDQSSAEWSKEELDSLCWYFPQSMDMPDPVGHISQLFLENCGQRKTRIEIIENLLKQGLIQEDQYVCMMERESTESEHIIKQKLGNEMDVYDGIKFIIDYLHKENCGFFLKWLQNSLLEACHAKLVVGQQQPSDLVEPVAYFNTVMKKPVPLVTWDQDLWKVMQLEPSIWLLSALNFELPTRAGQAKIFARIPSEWTADHLFVAALLMGPLDTSSLKFDSADLHVIEHSGQCFNSMDQSTNCIHYNSSLFGYFLGTSSSPDWLQKVKQIKSSLKVEPLEDKLERVSMISGYERDWDTRSMCVSDGHEDTSLS